MIGGITTPSVNGIRPTHNAWLIDGGYNIDTGGNWGSPLAPNIETVAEFRAIRGNYSAEFGTGGGSQFNVISKGARTSCTAHCTTSTATTSSMRGTSSRLRAILSSAMISAFSVGGPVYIPKVYNGKNKTFFFVLIGGISERSAAAV